MCKMYIAILVFHSNKETYRQYRLKNNYDQFFVKDLRNVDKMMKIAGCSIFRTKVSKNRII